MSTTDNGGAAFPCHTNPRPGHLADAPQGMTLRDYFAAKALVGLIAEPISEGSESTCVHSTPNNDDETRYWAPGERLATAAYVLADAMIRARGEA